MSGSTKQPKRGDFSGVLPALAKRGRGSESFRVGHEKSHSRCGWLFSAKFVPAERVKYAGACEMPFGREIRLRRVKERILFHIDQSRRRREIFHNFRKEIISHSAQAEYFT